MTQRLASADRAKVAAITVHPMLSRPAHTDVDRTFGLPTILFGATVGLYLAFLAVMSIAFLNAELAIPMVVFAGTFVFGFGVAGKWATMGPHSESRALRWDEFAGRGIDTMTGRLTAREATVQVLMLPALIFVWGVIVALIAAFH